MVLRGKKQEVVRNVIMEKFEYKEVMVGAEAQLISILNEQAKEGWEYVERSSNTSTMSVIIIFKRKTTDELKK